MLKGVQHADTPSYFNTIVWHVFQTIIEFHSKLAPIFCKLINKGCPNLLSKSYVFVSILLDAVFDVSRYMSIRHAGIWN